jgi:hypothetical protein
VLSTSSGPTSPDAASGARRPGQLVRDWATLHAIELRREWKVLAPVSLVHFTAWPGSEEAKSSLVAHARLCGVHVRQTARVGLELVAAVMTMSYVESP